MSESFTTLLFKLTLALCLALSAGSCSYLKHSYKQLEYSFMQEIEPGQANLKHMIDSETFFVYGRSIDAARNYTDLPMAITAFSSKHKANERVDTMYVFGSGTHYGLNLPAGTYDVLIFADSEAYSQKTRYLISTVGIYMMALQKKTLTPFRPEQVRFVAVANGEQAPHTDLEKGWLRFVNEYPEYKGN